MFMKKWLYVSNFSISAINPMKKVPAMVDGTFMLFESHAILIYLASVSPGIPEHWYPSDVLRRAKINSVLDWHHSNLRHGAFTFIFNSTIAPLLGLPLNLRAAAEGEKVLLTSLAHIESYWLEESGRFLVGSERPSIADLSLVCEIMQLMVLNDEDRNRILGPYKKVLKWIEDTKDATSPHFDEVHDVLNQVKEKLQKLPSAGPNVVADVSL
ncbi:hypothetical protein Leryth_006503 [Lithospermum erythrorhizon]|nr:hypothetical protein Leryth_006503 [Lithospermum erythrorhizon]